MQTLDVHYEEFILGIKVYTRAREAEKMGFVGINRRIPR